MFQEVHRRQLLKIGWGWKCRYHCDLDKSHFRGVMEPETLVESNGVKTELEERNFKS